MKTKQLLLFVLLSLLGFQAAKADSYTPSRGDKITTDNGVYVVNGDNIIANGDFSDGLNGWKAGDNSDLTADNFEIVADGGPDGGACIKALGGAGSGSNKTIKTGWAIETGKTYVFSVWAYRTSSGMSSNTQYSQVWLSNSATGADTEIGKITYTADTWVKSQFVFTADKPYFVAKFAWLNAASSFAYFYLAEVEKSNELVTASLETAIASAEELYNSTEEGQDRGQYTTGVRKALADAIAAAKSVLSAATTQDEILAAKTSLETAMNTYKTNVNPPFKLGVGYTITNVAASLSLTSGDGTVRIATPDFADSTQVFYFEKAPEGAEAVGYNLRDANGTYIWRSGSWDTKSGSTTLTAKNALFNIVDYGTYVQIKNEGSGSVLGVDNTTANSAVYSNKGGQNANNCWLLVRHTPTAVLESTIETAENTVANAEVGSEYYQVPQSAVDELTAAISSAKAALPTITTQEEGQKTVDALNAALDKFNASYNPLPNFATGENYTITHYSGNLLTATTSGNASITAKAEEGATDAQLVTFEKANYQDMTDIYYIRSVADGTYLARDGSYNTLWRADNDTLAAVVQVDCLDGKWLGLKFVSTSSYLGADSGNSGSLTYSDKAGTGNTGAYWTIESYVTVVLDRAAFNEAMTKAQEALAAMKPGYKVGEYFQEDIDAFAKVVASAKSAANKAKSQDELNAVTAQLIADTQVYVAKVHDKDYLNTTALKAEIDKATKTLSASVAGDCNGQYPQSAIDNLSAAIASATAVLDNAESTQAEVDAAVEALKGVEANFANAKVIVDYSALKTLITEVQKTIDEKADFVGDGPGRYSVESYDALKAAVASAQAVAKSNEVNQKTVDKEYENLENAVSTFMASFRANDYTELQALVDMAAELISKAEAGEIACAPEDLADLKESYSTNAAALESTDQNVIDKAAKLLRRDIDIFNNMTSGIEGILVVDSGAKVYTLGGTLVGNLANQNLKSGIYIIRCNVNGKTLVRKVAVK